MRRLFALMLLLCLCTAAAAEGSFTVPAFLDEIETEAFAGAAFTELHLADHPLTIGSRAFAGSSVRRVFLPKNAAVTIAGDAFAGASVTGYAADTSVNRDAMDQMVLSVEGDVHALIIGNSAYTALPQLVACQYDAQNMRSMLSRFRNVNCTVRLDRTVSQIRSDIGSVLGQAGPDDLCIFYYSGHGIAGGSLCGIRDGYNGLVDELSPYDLRAALDDLGARRIVVILDSCYSGSFIPEGSAVLYARAAADPAMEAAAQADSFNSAVLAAFSGGAMLFSRSADGPADGRYAVFTACAANEKAYAISNTYGLFTRALCLPLGWDCQTRTAAAMTADADSDGFITFAELSAKIPGTISYTSSQGATCSSRVQRSIPFPTLTLLLR